MTEKKRSSKPPPPPSRRPSSGGGQSSKAGTSKTRSSNKSNGGGSQSVKSRSRSRPRSSRDDSVRSQGRSRSKSRSSRSKSRSRSTTNNGDSHHRRSKSRSKQQDNHKRSSSKSKSQSKGSKAKSSSARSTAPVKNSKYLQERKQDQLRKSLPPPRRHEVNRRKSVPPPAAAAVRSSYLKARRSSLEALTAAALPAYEVRPDNSDDPPGLRHRIHLTDTNLNRSYKREGMKDMKSSLTGISLDTKALEVPTKTHDGNAGLFVESLDPMVKYDNLSGRPLPVSNASFRRRSKESLDTLDYIEDDTSDNGSGQSSSTESHEILEADDFKKLLVAIKSLKSLGDVLLYKTDEGIVEGRICHIHTDNPLEPYYTINLPDGTELQ